MLKGSHCRWLFSDCMIPCTRTTDLTDPFCSTETLFILLVYFSFEGDSKSSPSGPFCNIHSKRPLLPTNRPSTTSESMKKFPLFRIVHRSSPVLTVTLSAFSVASNGPAREDVFVLFAASL